MKKIIRNVAGVTAGVLFALSPLILLVTYFTYTEKEILPVIMFTMLVCGIILIVTEEEI